MLNELHTEIVPVLLHEEDRNAMGNSIENRSPYLDSNLIEYLACVPTKYLVRNGFAKAILRDSVSEYVPKKINYNTRKVGFNVPIEAYIQNFDDIHLTNLFSAESPIMDLVNKEPILELLHRKGQRTNEESKFLFSFISCALFMQIYA